MRSLLKYFFISLCFLLLPITAEAVPYKVLRVIDGDTIEILYRGKAKEVEFLCVDTPDYINANTGQNINPGEDAYKFIKMKLDNKVVDLEFEGGSRDINGRLLAYVYVHGVNLNIELVGKGLSPYYTEYGKSKKYDNEFRAAETAAMGRKLGIWSDPELARIYLSLKSEWERELKKYNRIYTGSRNRSLHNDSVIIINPENEEKPKENKKKSAWPEKKKWGEAD